MVTDFYDKVVVKIKYGGFDGSGVLIPDVRANSTYLISAWHCFGKDLEIDYSKIQTFRQEENVVTRIFLEFKDKVIIEEKDIIVFELDYLEDIPSYQIICPEVKEKVSFVGFPNGLSREECKTSRYIIRGNINECPNASIVQVNSERNFETYFSDAKKNMAGYSGCGIFVESEENIYLCGIITELGSEEGLFSFVNGISIVDIDSVIYQAKKRHLPDIKWFSFSKYSKSTLNIFEEPLANVCSVQLPQIIEQVTPNDIIEHCGNKIVWPYSDRTIHKQEVWEEWLLYLIIRCIENKENIKNEDFYVIKNKDSNRKVKVLYATKHTKLPEFLKDYLENAYQDISTGQVMIVKTDTTPAFKRIASKKIDEIVTDISDAIGTENNLYIDVVQSNIGKISVIHISALVDEMTRFVHEEGNEDLKGRELEEKLGERITEVLYGI